MASCYADCRGAVAKLEHERAAELELDALEAEELAALFAAQEEERQRLASAHRAAVAELRARHSAPGSPAKAAAERRRQAELDFLSALPFFGDDIFVLIAAELDVRMLGRLACVALRFWRKTISAPRPASPERWSVAEEGARRGLRAQSEQVRGWVSRAAGGSWMRALRQAEKLQRPLRFTSDLCGSMVQVSEAGTDVTKNGGGWQGVRWKCFLDFSRCSVSLTWKGSRSRRPSGRRSRTTTSPR